MKNLLITAIALSSALAATADPIDFSYSPKGAVTTSVGTKKAETYNVAINVIDPSFVGAKVTAAQVAVPVNATDVKFFITTKLEVVKEGSTRVNVADVCTVDATLSENANGWSEAVVTFPEPYTITDTGCYVGYTFTIPEIVTAEDSRPVSVVKGVNAEALYISTTKTYLKWKSYSSSLNGISTLQVTIDGAFGDDCVAVSVPSELNFNHSVENFDINAEITNHGNASISSLGYRLKAGEYTISGTKEFASPLKLQFGRSASVTFTLPEKLPVGEYSDCEFTLTEVNASPDRDPSAKSSTDIYVMESFPKNRPLMEEYTGLWCGYCPRGYVAVETLKEEFPDDFVAICYHYNDPMMIPGDMPQTPEGYPAAYLNRGEEMDPFYGSLSSSGTFGMRDNWLSLREQFTPWNIDVNARWDDPDGASDMITVDAEITNVKSLKGNYRIACAIIADGLESSHYVQVNNYSHSRDAFWDDYPVMQLFINAANPAKGLVYNDVIVAHSPYEGEAGLIPANPTLNTVSKARFTYSKADFVNYLKSPLPCIDSEMRAIVLVIDEATGAVMNCNQAKITGRAGIGSVTDDVVPADCEYYDLSGRRIDGTPQSGLYIRRDHYPSGKITATKILR